MHILPGLLVPSMHFIHQNQTSSFLSLLFFPTLVLGGRLVQLHQFFCIANIPRRAKANHSPLEETQVTP